MALYTVTVFCVVEYAVQPCQTPQSNDCPPPDKWLWLLCVVAVHMLPIAGLMNMAGDGCLVVPLAVLVVMASAGVAILDGVAASGYSYSCSEFVGPWPFVCALVCAYSCVLLWAGTVGDPRTRTQHHRVQ